MKIFFLLICFSVNTWSAQLVLSEWDQANLAKMLDKLPSTFVQKTQRHLSVPVSGTEMTLSFSAADEPFSVVCTRTFYRDSPEPSLSTCEMQFDVNHQKFDEHYDEIIVNLTSPNLSKAFFNAIPFGKPIKEAYSFGKDKGRTYEGNRGWIFHYHFICQPEQCVLKFSSKKLKN